MVWVILIHSVIQTNWSSTSIWSQTNIYTFNSSHRYWNEMPAWPEITRPPSPHELPLNARHSAPPWLTFTIQTATKFHGSHPGSPMRNLYIWLQNCKLIRHTVERKGCTCRIQYAHDINSIRAYSPRILHLIYACYLTIIRWRRINYWDWSNFHVIKLLTLHFLS